MKKLLAIIPVLLLTGCLATAPVKREFPGIPPELEQACPDLQQADIETKHLSDLISTVTKNYSEYHQCKIKLDLWVEWYKQQKEIFDSVK